jgi:hypothetical protein
MTETCRGSHCCASLQALGLDMPSAIQFQHPRADLGQPMRGHPAQDLSLFEGHDESTGVGFRQIKMLTQDDHEVVPTAAPTGGDVWPAGPWMSGPPEG